MSTAADIALQPDTTLLPGPGDAGKDPAERGETRIGNRVVERIVSAAADEIGKTAGTSRRILGITLGQSDRPDAQAEVNGDVVTATVSLAVHYPSPVRHVAAEVRRHVMERVEELTGLRVAEVDIKVASLVPDLQPRVW